jgi:hypothetical protein
MKNGNFCLSNSTNYRRERVQTNMISFWRQYEPAGMILKRVFPRGKSSLPTNRKMSLKNIKEMNHSNSIGLRVINFLLQIYSAYNKLS